MKENSNFYIRYKRTKSIERAANNISDFIKEKRKSTLHEPNQGKFTFKTSDIKGQENSSGTLFRLTYKPYDSSNDPDLIQISGKTEIKSISKDTILTRSLRVKTRGKNLNIERHYTEPQILETCSAQALQEQVDQIETVLMGQKNDQVKGFSVNMITLAGMKISGVVTGLEIEKAQKDGVNTIPEVRIGDRNYNIYIDTTSENNRLSPGLVLV